MKHEIWSGCVSFNLLTIMNHWRRLKCNPDRRRQALYKATSDTAAVLSELLALEPRFGEAWNNANEACKKAKKGQKGENDACHKAADMTVDRSWIENGDDVSSEVPMDSKGYPMMLKTPDASKERYQAGQHQAVARNKASHHPLPRKAEDLQGFSSRRPEKSPCITQSSWGQGPERRQSPSAGKLPILSKKCCISQRGFAAASPRNGREVGHHESSSQEKKAEKHPMR